MQYEIILSYVRFAGSVWTGVAIVLNPVVAIDLGTLSIIELGVVTGGFIGFIGVVVVVVVVSPRLPNGSPFVGVGSQEKDF